MRLFSMLLLLLICFLFNGCFLTKVVTIPMRVGGAIISVVPICGDTIDDAIDEAANMVDKVPL